MTTAQYQVIDFAVDDPSTIKNKVANNSLVGARGVGAYQCYAASTPNMTVKVAAGGILVNNALVENAIQTSGTITAPSANPRIDRVVIDWITGVASIVTGAEAGSPVPPAVPAGKFSVAQIALATSTTAITNSLITDERASVIAPPGTSLFTLSSIISPAQITGNQNDYAPTGYATASTYRLSTDASRDITGLAGGSDGQIKVLLNVGSQNAVLKNENAGSSAANRFALTADITLLPKQGVILRYDGTAARWHAIGAAGSASVKSGSVPLQVLKWGALNMDQNVTRYADALGKGENATEADVQFIVLEKCTLKNLYAFANAAIPASNSLAVTVRKNGADTALTCTIGAAATTAEDTSNSVTFEPYDEISLKLVASATMTSTIDFTFAALAIKNGSAIDEGASLLPIYAQPGGAAFATEGGALTGASTEVELPLPECLLIGPSMDNGTLVTDTYRNGAAAGNKGYGSGVPVGFAASDRFSLSVNTTGAFVGPAKLTTYSPSTLYDPCPVAFSSNSQAQNVTRYAGGWGKAGVATESEVQIRMPKPCTVRNLRALSNSAVAATTTTVEIMKNGTGTGVIATLGTSSRYAEDVTNTATFAAGDLLSLKVISGATTGTRDYNCTVEVFN